ncbi:TIGR01244 family sulfur transferase [Marinospirillum sp. MEB164]|uniref:TIGR01244 family sulfur transferase n=1 Tax=Marinospirillum alkalitolerans TaxID=3123374 RepID=A0ABW8PT88_9GAMM
MPALRHIEADLATTGQLTPEDLRQLVAQGFQTFIFNRPDQEEADQPETQALQETAEALGATWIHQPVVSGQVTDEQGAEFGRLYAAAPKPVLAFCRTGARCGTLWALSQQQQRPGHELVAQLKEAGFDLPDLFQRLTHNQA